jgi:cellulose biosynthesis protein BcsQ
MEEQQVTRSGGHKERFPGDMLLTTNALVGPEILLIPVQPADLPMAGLKSLLELIAQIRQQ